MKSYWAPALCTVLLASCTAIDAHGQASVARAHVAAAKDSVSPKTSNPMPGQNLTMVYSSCMHSAEEGALGLRPLALVSLTRKQKLTPMAHEKWYVPPVKVFDNLYFIGTQTESTWALTTSAGIILLNTNFDWVTPELLNELKTFGLDPANIKYAVVVRSHSDQAWGINALKKMVPSARVIMSEVDWDLLAKDNSPASVKPVKDMVAKDGQKLTLGDTTITLYSTPTSTPGNLSAIFPLRDGSQRHHGRHAGRGLHETRAGRDSDVPRYADHEQNLYRIVQTFQGYRG